MLSIVLDYSALIRVFFNFVFLLCLVIFVFLNLFCIFRGRSYQTLPLLDYLQVLSSTFTFFLLFFWLFIPLLDDEDPTCIVLIFIALNVKLRYQFLSTLFIFSLFIQQKISLNFYLTVLSSIASLQLFCYISRLIESFLLSDSILY